MFEGQRIIVIGRSGGRFPVRSGLQPRALAPEGAHTQFMSTGWRRGPRQPAVRRAHPPVLTLGVLALLGGLAGCDATESTTPTLQSREDDDTGVDAPFDPVDLGAPVAQSSASSDEPGDPASCITDLPRSWAFAEPTTVGDRISVADYLTPTDIVVARDGTATVVYQSAADLALTADDPPAAGDPLDPSGGRDETWLWPGDHLALDGSGTQTVVVQEPVRFNSNTFRQFDDLVVADRTAGGSWSTAPVTVKDREITGEVDLAVNASGAAVLVWSQNEHHLATYRTGAGAPWGSPERVPTAGAIDVEVDIDDAGRVLFVYDRLYDSPAGVYATRRTRSGTWTPRRQLGGPGTELFEMAMNPHGVAVVSRGPTDDGAFLGRIATSRMAADGTWQAPVQQPHALGFHGVGVDERGRALVGGWDRGSLWGRRSGTDGTWRQPFTITSGVRDTGRWGLEPRVMMNGRGDALAAWGTKSGAGDLSVRARFAPAGRAWTKPMRVTPPKDQPTLFDAAIGECGHAAFAWTPAGKPRLLHIRRATPAEGR
jgi:hypothetical protein